MSISNLIQSCGYRIGKLVDAIYVIDKDATKDIRIDNGSAYINSLSSGAIRAIKAYNIALEDTEELKKRYKFTHSIKFSVKGYSNKSLFDGDYYFAVKSIDGTYWFLNPLIPCKVTYTYTLDNTDERTDFTLSIASNFPTLRLIYNGNLPNSSDCKYKRSTFKSLILNEAQYVAFNDDKVINTNDGFKRVDFIKNTATFTETYDGNTLQHSLSFRITFDAYTLQSSWHYNLLEFQDNKYAAIIETTNGKTILAGFNIGLLPSYTVTANDAMDIDNIEIRLTDKCNNCTSIPYLDSVSLRYDTAKTWVYTTKYNGYECIGNNLARYVLQQEIDSFLNPTGNYKCLSNYVTYFRAKGLNIVDTFSDYQTFECAECADECDIQTSFPPRLEFNGTGSQYFDLICDSSWSISTNDGNLSIYPSGGGAGSSYNVRVRNDSSSPRNSTLTLNYCSNKSRTYPVTVKNTNDGCFPSGRTYYVDASAQYLTIPKYCCVESITETSNTLNNIEIQETSIKVWIPANPYTSQRTFTLNLTMCMQYPLDITIYQNRVYENWYDEGTECNGVYLCTKQRRYTGTTPTLISISAATNDTRYVNCDQDSTCQTQYRLKSLQTICVEENQYVQYIKQYSYDGTNWIDTYPAEYELKMTARNTASCSYCGVHTTMPDTIYFSSGNVTQYFDLLCDSDWTATVSGSGIVLGTTSGSANSAISFSVTNYNIPTKNDTIGKIIINACNREYTYSIVTNVPTTCLKSPATYYAPSSGGTFTLPIESDCTLTSVTETSHTLNMSIRNNTVIVNNMSENTSVNSKLFHIELRFGGYQQGVGIRLIQQGVQSRYLHYSSTCVGNRRCSIDRRYTGHSVTNIDTITNTQRYTNCLISDNCYIKFTAQYNGGEEYEGICDDSGTITAAETNPQGYSIYSMSSCTIGNCVEVIGNQAFQDSGLISIEIPIGITRIEDYAFRGSTGLTYIIFNSITPPTLGSDVFYNIGEARDYVIYVPCGYVSAYKTAWPTYASKIVATPPCVPPQLKLSAYYNGVAEPYELDCDQSNTLSSGETTPQGYTRSAMTQATVGDCITSLGDDCFKNCTSLSSLTIPNTVTSIGSAACNSCSALTSVSIPNSVTYIGGYAFQRCSGLTSIALPENLSSLGAYAFTLCKSLSSVTMNSLLVLDNYTFSSCGNLKRINSNVDGVYNIPNGVASINTSCFRDCSGLTDLYLPNSLETIGNNAFMNCTNLSGLTIPTGVTSIGQNAFYSCTSLINVGIPHSVTSIGTYAFMNCRRITSVIIGSGITSIGNYAFQNCSNLVSLTVNATTPPSLGTTAFYNTNPNLKIYVPANSVDAYKSASGWSDYSSRIQAI